MTCLTGFLVNLTKAGFCRWPPRSPGLPLFILVRVLKPDVGTVIWCVGTARQARPNPLTPVARIERHRGSLDVIRGCEWGFCLTSWVLIRQQQGQKNVCQNDRKTFIV